MEINKNLRVSTMTLVSKISTNINLSKLYEHINISDHIKFIEYGDKPTKGEPYNKKKKKKDKKNYFYNQITIHVMLDKFVNVKMFNNGRIQMTGLKSRENGINIINIIIKEIQKLSEEKKSEIVDNDIIEILNTDIVLINSDFDIKSKINNEILQRIIIENGYYSSYEPLIYPGVNIKYYFNPERQNNGICNCDRQCDGKGKNGLCKKVTIAVFNSGKIIITGWQKIEHLNTAYDFITNLINEKKEEIMIK